MLFNGKLIEQIDEGDLIRLVGNASESQTLDVKRNLYQFNNDGTEKPRWKVEFCADLTSFANAFGGWIICGIDEESGQVSELCGLDPNFDMDGEILRLQQIANTGIEPRIPNLRFRAVNLASSSNSNSNSKVLLIYIPRSFIGPHRVKETSKFHFRNSNGKHEMSVDELRIAFNLLENLTDRVRKFSKERINLLASNDYHEDIPVMLGEGPRIVLHSIPLTTLSLGTGVELRSFEFIDKSLDDYEMRTAFAYKRRFNYQGIVIPFFYPDDKAAEYFQVFRNGVIEYLFLPGGSSNDTQIVIHAIENSALVAVEIIMKMQQNLGIEPPMAILLGLVNVKGFKWFFHNRQDRAYAKSDINQSKLILPDVIVSTFEENCKSVMKPLFDILWNTAGFARSQSYDRDGNWQRDEPKWM